MKLKVPSAHWSGWPCAGNSLVIPDAKHECHAHLGRKGGNTEAAGPVGLVGQTQRTQEGEAGGARQVGKIKGREQPSTAAGKYLVSKDLGFGGTEAIPSRTGSWNTKPQGVVAVLNPGQV